MMVKERIVESYGPIRYTIGTGCSGGSIQQNVIADQYPGLLDGIQPYCSYPDTWTTGSRCTTAACCSTTSTRARCSRRAAAQRGAVTGQESETPCRSWRDVYGFAPTVGDPRIGCEGLVLGPQVPTYTPPAYVYDPVNNPRGARCTKQDYEVAILGKRPDGKAKNAYDNVGVQYGLQALQSGTLTAEQFVDVNEKVGGQGIDYANTPARTAADPGALATLYRSGRINDARGLRTVPIIDLRGADNYEIHTDYNSYVLRERLKRSNGTDANYAMFTAMTPLVVPPAVTEKAFLLMDRWLAGIEADHSALSLQQKVLQHKPTEAVDTCFVGDRAVTDPTACRHALPYFSNPRIAAGEPFTNDVVKCRLKPLVRTDYADGTFTDAQWDRLRAVFPGGVCNYAVPGVDQQYAAGFWTSFAAGPGGRSLGAAPASMRG